MRILIIALFIMSCGGVKKASSSNDLETEKANLKNYGLCQCLNNQYKTNDSISIQDGSISGYFEQGTSSIENYEKVDSFVKNYNFQNFKSIDGKSLSTMKCIQVYNSKEFDLFIDSLLKQ